MSSCDYLDIMPENVATMDMVFNTRQTAERMLYTCYGYVPDYASPWANPGMAGTDEVWNAAPQTFYYSNSEAYALTMGLQNASDPYLNYWSGGRQGKNLFIAIRDCNIFLENIDNVYDMTLSERSRWKAEVQALKAFYHYWLFQHYGPIPFVENDLPMSASSEQMKTVIREPVDDVVAKIVELLDTALKEEDALPLYIRSINLEMGRLTRPAALAIKAKVLVLAASPLFNGNPDFPDFKNAEGIPFINPTADPAKWEAARDACLAAIKSAHEAGHELYEIDRSSIMGDYSDTTLLEIRIRDKITSKYNKELLWGLGGNQSTTTLTGICNPPLTIHQQGKEMSWCKSMHNPTMDIAEMFYSKNGLPIDEDKEWNYGGRYKTAPVPPGHEYYVEQGVSTANLNYYREPRYYAWIGFDKGKWFNLEAVNEKSALIVRNKKGEISGRSHDSYCITGFFAKKLVSYKLVMTESSKTSQETVYPFPIIRLSDIYLCYAEALNECKSAPDAEVYEYLQKVRDKAGLDTETGGIVETWAQYSSDPTKPTRKNGLREIIHTERMIELSFEGQRYYDLRRWRKAMDYFNRPVRGWNVNEDTEEGYYQVRYIAFRKYMPRDYFWPVKMNDIYVNRNLIQSPLW
jgi:hypothetical protein